MAGNSTDRLLESLAAIVQRGLQPAVGQQHAPGLAPSNGPLRPRATAGAGSLQPSLSEQPSGVSGDNVMDLVSQAMAAGKGIGTKLQEGHASQLSKGVPLEEYSIEHAQRLFMYVTKDRHVTDRNVLCKNVHGDGCNECKSCHSCRQKWVDIPLTTCSSCDRVQNQVGGPHRGKWCGNCLWTRMGENIDEVLQLNNWLCPGCRDLCTCSAANCKRMRMGWFATHVLSVEAREQGYRSTAHYLVLTHLSQRARAAALGAPGDLPARPHQLLRAVAAEGAGVARKRKRVDPQQEHDEQLQRQAAPYLRREYQAILEELGDDLGGAMAPSLAALGLGRGLTSSGSGFGGLGAGNPGAVSAVSARFEVADMLARDLEGEEDEGDGDVDDDDLALPRDFAQRLVARPSAAAAKHARREAAAPGGSSSSVQPSANPAVPSGVPYRGAQRGPALPATGSGYDAAWGPGGSPGLPGSSSAARFGELAAASMALWRSQLLPPRHPPPRPLQRPQQQQQDAMHRGPLPAEGEHLATPAAPMAPAPMLPALGAILGGLGLSGGAGAGAAPGRAQAAATAGEASRGPTAPSQAAAEPAASIVAHGTSAAAGPAEAGWEETHRTRQREELETLLQHDNAEGLHTGVPNVGDAAPGAQRRRPAVQQAPRQTHVTPHLPRQGLVAAAPKQPTLRQPGGEAQAPRQHQHQQQRSPVEQSTSRGEGLAAVDVADSSGQLGLFPEEEAAGTAASGGHKGISALESPAGGAGAASVAPAQAPPVHKTVSLLPSPPTLQPFPSASTPAAIASSAAGPATAAVFSGWPQADAVAWDCMYSRISAALRAHQDMYECAYGSGEPLPGVQDIAALYQESHTECMARLGCEVRQAERWLQQLSEPAVLCKHGSRGAANRRGCDVLFSHQGLKSCLRVYSLLAKVLDEPDVQSYVVRRVLAQDPFVDFTLSDNSARRALLKGWLELAATLHDRGLPVADAFETVAQALTSVADELRQAIPVLDSLYHVEQLQAPPSGYRIGPWQFDEARPLAEAFGTLNSFVDPAKRIVLVPTLCDLLALCSGSKSEGLALQAAGVLTAELLRALLDPSRRLSSADARHAALLLLRQALDSVGSKASDADLRLTAAQLQQRRGARERLCDVVGRVAVPLLRAMVGQEFSVWKVSETDWAAIAAAAPAGPAPPAGLTGAGELEETQGLAKVDVLAHCYGFLAASGAMRWDQVEAAITRPYSSHTFWRFAGSPYRYMAVTMLAVCIQRAPQAMQQHQSRGGALRVWVSALLDKGGRLGAQQLTQALAANPATSVLFSGIEQEELEMVAGDVSGEVRTRLLVSVVRRMVANLPTRRQELGEVFNHLDEVLASRKKDIKDRYSLVALMRWQVFTAGTLLGMLREVPLHGPGRPGPQVVDASMATRLKSLLKLVAGWAVDSCSEIMKALAKSAEAGSGAAGGPPWVGGVAKPQQEEAEAAATELRGHVRASLKATVFGLLPDIWRLLVAWGAPGRLEEDQELLRPLWTILSSCLEMCSGALDPIPTERVMLELLAHSLASAAVPQLPPQLGAAAAPAPALAPLCDYVLSTIVQYYLSRAHIKHVSNERAAVIALRLVEALLNEPSMRSVGATLAVLRPLLRPFQGLMCEVGQDPSAFSAPSSVREALYRLLANLLTSLDNWAALLKRPPQEEQQQPGQQQRQQQEQDLGAVQHFFKAALQDVLQCVVAAVRFGGAPEALVQEQLAKVAPKLACPAPLKPPTTPEWNALGNQLLALHRPHSLAAIELVRSAQSAAAPRDPGAGAGGQQPLFRPGNFLWACAERGIELVQTLAVSGAAPEIALACFPALHYLILGTKQHGKPLQRAYDQLRKALEAALGSEKLKPWGVVARRREHQQAQHAPARADSAQLSSQRGGGSGRPEVAGGDRQPQQLQAQESQQQQKQDRAEVPATRQQCWAAAQSDSQATRSSSPAGGRCRPAAYTTDQQLHVLPSLEKETELPLTALLGMPSSALKAQAQDKQGRGALVLALRDFSGSRRTPQECRVVVDVPGLVAQLLREVHSEDPAGDPVVLRLTHLKVLGVTSQSKATLKCSIRTTIEVQPPSSAADALRSWARLYTRPTSQQRRQQRQQCPDSPPSPSVASAWPSPVPSRGQSHGIGSAPTQAFHFSEAQPQAGPSLGGLPVASAAVSQRPGFGPGAAAQPSGGWPALSTAPAKGTAGVLPKRRRLEGVHCSQAGPPAGHPQQEQLHRLGRIAYGVQSGTQHTEKDVAWALKQIPGWKSKPIEEAVQLALRQLGLLGQVVQQLGGMGYAQVPAEAAAKAVWGQGLAADELVGLAVDQLLSSG